MGKKEKTETTPVWQLKGFGCKKSYYGWLHFNGLVSEESTYDTLYANQFTGETVNLDKE